MLDDISYLLEKIINARTNTKDGAAIRALAVALSDIRTRLVSLETEGQIHRETRQLVGTCGVPFPDGSMLVQTLHKTKYFIDPNDLVMAPQLVVYRQWEADLSSYMVESVTPDTVFVDVGANFGYFTCLAGSYIGNQGNGKVIAFEANPKIFDLLRKNVKINWSMCPIDIYDCAISDKVGHVDFFAPKEGAANAHIVSKLTTAPQGSIRVHASTLNHIIGKTSVDIMKVDVEGFETAVLRGASAVLESSPRINLILEWSQKQMSDAGFTSEDMLSLMDQHSLEAHRLPRNRFIADADWAQLRLEPKSLRDLAYDNICLRKTY